MKSRGRLCDWRVADTEEGQDLTVPARRSSQAGGGVRAHSQPLKAGSPGTVWAEASPMGTEHRASFPPPRRARAGASPDPPGSSNSKPMSVMQRAMGRRGVYPFPAAAVTKNYKLSGLSQHKHSSLLLQRSEVKNRLGGLVPSGGCRAESTSLPFQLLEVATFLAHSSFLASPNLCFPCHAPFLLRTLVITLCPSR